MQIGKEKIDLSQGCNFYIKKAYAFISPVEGRLAYLVPLIVQVCSRCLAQV